MFKNTASQQWVVFAFQDEGGSNPGEPVTADQANITANVRIDAGSANAVDDTNPTVLSDGYYSFGITAAESNGDSIVITPVSSTANVNVIGVPGAVYTVVAALTAAEVNAEMDAALDTAIPELAVAAPTATPTVRTGLMLMYMAMRNKLIVQTSGTDALELYNSAGTKIAAKVLTDDGSDYTEAKMV